MVKGAVPGKFITRQQQSAAVSAKTFFADTVGPYYRCTNYGLKPDVEQAD